ncbi:MAG: hypothetical protein OXF93_13230 [Acidobacteria bacterium]|nr:hypothetical protein [Acidobacteriota bacterium]
MRFWVSSSRASSTTMAQYSGFLLQGSQLDPTVARSVEALQRDVGADPRPPARRVQRRDAPRLRGAPGLSLLAHGRSVTASPSVAYLLGEAADVVADDADLDDYQQVVDRGNANADLREYRDL